MEGRWSGESFWLKPYCRVLLPNVYQKHEKLLRTEDLIGSTANYSIADGIEMKRVNTSEENTAVIRALDK